MSILACLAWANTAARVPLEPLMLYVATISGPSPGKPRVASKTRAGVLVEALFAVDAQALHLHGRVGLEVALDGAHALAVGVVLPSAGEVVGGGALLALFVEEANAVGVGEALARLGWGGANHNQGRRGR
eukprot:scaffold1907_cov118-Isochrysis_galbana.AAC.2